MSKIRANFISSKNDNKAVEFTSGIVVGGAVTATNFDFNAEVYNVGTGASIGNPANNELALGTNNTEKLRITSGGTIGVGNNGSYPIYSAANDRNLILGTGDGNNGIQLHSSETGYAGIYFGDTDSGQSRYSGYVEYKNNENFLRFGTTNGERVRITSGGELQIANGNLKLSTAGTGIDFSATGQATGMSNELLDDYEEGSWTPTGTSDLSSVSNGRYIKVGRLVTITCRLNFGSSSSSTRADIGGLPFTPDQNLSNSAMGSAVGETTYTGADRPFAGIEIGGIIRFRINGGTSMTYANWSSKSVRMSLSYFSNT